MSNPESMGPDLPKNTEPTSTEKDMTSADHFRKLRKQIENIVGPDEIDRHKRRRAMEKRLNLR